MKYFMAPTTVVENGPGGKPLSLVHEKKEVTEEDFYRHIDEFIEDSDVDDKTKAAGREKIVSLLQAGKTVTVEDYTLTIKK